MFSQFGNLRHRFKWTNLWGNTRENITLTSCFVKKKDNSDLNLMLCKINYEIDCIHTILIFVFFYSCTEENPNQEECYSVIFCHFYMPTDSCWYLAQLFYHTEYLRKITKIIDRRIKCYRIAFLRSKHIRYHLFVSIV